MSNDYSFDTQEGGEGLVEIAKQENTLDHAGDLIVVLDVPDPDDVGYVPNDCVGIDFHLIEQQALRAGSGNPIPQPSQRSSITEYRFRVSSRHLCLASAYFRNLLEGPSPSITGTAQQPSIVRIPEVKNATAFLLLMKIIHGFIHQIPQEIPAGILGDIALMAAYFQCTGTVEVFAMTWLEQAVKKQPRPGRRREKNDGYQYFLAGYVFRHPLAFGIGANKAVRQSQGPLKSIIPLIPEFIINCINTWRKETMDKILETMKHLCREENRVLSDVQDFAPPDAMDFSSPSELWVWRPRQAFGPLPDGIDDPSPPDFWEWTPLQEPDDEVSLDRYFDLAEAMLILAEGNRDRAVGTYIDEEMLYWEWPGKDEEVMDLISSAQTVIRCFEEFVFPLPEPETW